MKCDTSGGVRTDVEFPHRGLDRQIRAGDALVLAHMLEPALDHEHLEVAARIGGVDEVVPVDRAVAAADVRVGGQRRGEGVAILGRDGVFDGDQHRPAIAGQRLLHDRRRPMPRRAQIEAVVARQAPAQRRHARRREPAGRQHQRPGNAPLVGDHAPQHAAEHEAAVEHHLRHRQAARLDPLRQRHLRRHHQARHHCEPGRADDQHDRHRQRERVRGRQRGGGGGGDQTAAEHEPVGRDAAADCGQHQRAGDGARADGAEQHAVDVRPAPELVARDQRQQRPIGAREQEERPGMHQRGLERRRLAGTYCRNI